MQVSLFSFSPPQLEARQKRWIDKVSVPGSVFGADLWRASIYICFKNLKRDRQRLTSNDLQLLDHFLPVGQLTLHLILKIIWRVPKAISDGGFWKTQFMMTRRNVCLFWSSALQTRLQKETKLKTGLFLKKILFRSSAKTCLNQSVESFKQEITKTDQESDRVKKVVKRIWGRSLLLGANTLGECCF